MKSDCIDLIETIRINFRSSAILTIMLVCDLNRGLGKGFVLLNFPAEVILSSFVYSYLIKVVKRPSVPLIPQRAH